MSLCLYALVALNRDSPLSTEAAMKYFVLGALSSGLLLYGMSMIYGATGTLDIREVARVTAQLAGASTDRSFLVFGLVFLVAGLAFKIGVAPFHMWIPDVYHGAPTAVTLVIGSAPKVAAFAMAVRVLINGLPDLAQDWQEMLALLALLSMAIGNITAIAQSNLKRMLAYSTIAHMGDGRVRQHALQVRLGDGGDVADRHRQQREQRQHLLPVLREVRQPVDQHPHRHGEGRDLRRRADHQRHRGRRAVVDVRNPHVERRHADLEGKAGDEEHQPEHQERAICGRAGELRRDAR